jgi:hypothetical protein
MDAAEGSKFQIPIAKSQKGLTTDYADSTDEKQDPSSSVPSALSMVSELFVETLPCAWELALGIRDFALETE